MVSLPLPVRPPNPCILHILQCHVLVCAEAEDTTTVILHVPNMPPGMEQKATGRRKGRRRNRVAVVDGSGVTPGGRYPPPVFFAMCIIPIAREKQTIIRFCTLPLFLLSYSKEAMTVALVAVKMQLAWHENERDGQLAGWQQLLFNLYISLALPTLPPSCLPVPYEKKASFYVSLCGMGSVSKAAKKKKKEGREKPYAIPPFPTYNHHTILP